MNEEAQKLIGINDVTAPPTTHLGWLLNLIKNHGQPGLRYAVALKINHALECDSDGKVYADLYAPHTGFSLLVDEVLGWNDPMSAALIDLLQGEYSWAVPYVKDLVPELTAGKPTSSKSPLTTIEVNNALARDFKGKGLAYALRFYTAPPTVDGESACQRSPYNFRLFLEAIKSRRDWVSSRLDELMAEPEFLPYADLMIPLVPIAATGGILGTGILTPI